MPKLPGTGSFVIKNPGGDHPPMLLPPGRGLNIGAGGASSSPNGLGLVVGLVVGHVDGPVVGLVVGLVHGPMVGLVVGFVAGHVVGLVVGLVAGGGGGGGPFGFGGAANVAIISGAPNTAATARIAGESFFMGAPYKFDRCG